MESQSPQEWPPPAPLGLFILMFVGHTVLGSGIFSGSCCQWDSGFQMAISYAAIQPHPATQPQDSLHLGSLDPPFSPLPSAQKRCHHQLAFLDHYPTVPCPPPLLPVALCPNHPGPLLWCVPSSHCPKESQPQGLCYQLSKGQNQTWLF